MRRRTPVSYTHLLEQAELRQRQLRVEVGGQTDAVAHHGLQRRAAVRGGIAERISGQQAAQAERGADVSGRDQMCIRDRIRSDDKCCFDDLILEYDKKL